MISDSLDCLMSTIDPLRNNRGNGSHRGLCRFLSYHLHQKERFFVGDGPERSRAVGNGRFLVRSDPSLILPTGVKQVSAGRDHTLILKVDGSLWGMGSNANGQLGLNATSGSNLPVMIVPSAVRQISAGGDHSVFIKKDGSLLGMGSNSGGELGLGDLSPRLVPAQIIASGVEQAIARQDHTHFLKSDATLWGMGGNQHGVLGTGDSTARPSPFQIDSQVLRLADVPEPWPQATKATAPDGAAFDEFGMSVSSRAIFLPSGHNMPIRVVLCCRSGLSLSIGSQWIRHLPDQSHRSRWRLPAIILASPYPSRAIFWPSGLSGPIRAVLNNAGAAYLYQLEANGSATYLTKVTAPDGAASDWFRILRFPVGQYSGRRGIQCRSGRAKQCRGGLSLSIGSQWIRYLSHQSDRSRWGRRRCFRHLRFPVGQYSRRRGKICQSDPGGYLMPGRLIFINWKPMDPPPT